MTRFLRTFALAGAIALCMMVAVTVQAGTMRISAMFDLKTYESRATFEPSKEHPGEDWLYLTQAQDDVEFEMEFNMTGQKKQQAKGRKKVSEVPGVTEGITGYKRAKLETFGNEVTLVIETKLVRKKQKDGKDVEEKEENVQRIPLQFKDKAASVENLKTDKSFEMRITPAGLKDLLEQGKTKAESGLNISAQGKGAKSSLSGSASFLRSSRKGVAFVSAKKIQYEAPPMHIHVSGKVRANMPE